MNNGILFVFLLIKGKKETVAQLIVGAVSYYQLLTAAWVSYIIIIIIIIIGKKSQTNI